ncbi:ABC transporter permease [Algihabitans albus]|uniref:ABC transporter permease n=1 Tax=Algihabitans albus TaxID=2164067 RepID=UPI0035CF3D90
MSAGFLLRKLARAGLTIWLCVTFVFIVLRLSGDPATTILPIEIVTPEIEAEFRQKWGLDAPLHSQYAAYFLNVFKGDLGYSFVDGRDAVEVVFERLPKTAELMAISAIFTLLLGIPAGIYAALHRNSTIDRLVMLASVIGFSVPSFFLAVLLILVFSVTLGVLPSSGSETWRHAVLPVFVLATAWSGIFARFVRSAMLDVLNQDYVRAALARGVPWMVAVRRHALPNAAIPTATMLGLFMGGLITGAIIVETVFAWPGIGRLLIDAVGNRDLAVVQVIILLAASSMVLANLLVDLTYGWLDPRVGANDGTRG